MMSSLFSEGHVLSCINIVLTLIIVHLQWWYLYSDDTLSSVLTLYTTILIQCTDPNTCYDINIHTVCVLIPKYCTTRGANTVK